jgi:hypothetical protein
MNVMTVVVDATIDTLATAAADELDVHGKWLLSDGNIEYYSRNACDSGREARCALTRYSASGAVVVCHRVMAPCERRVPANCR